MTDKPVKDGATRLARQTADEPRCPYYIQVKVLRKGY